MSLDLVIPVAVVLPGFVYRGPKRWSEATEQGRVYGRRDFRKFGYASFCLNFMHENVILLDIIIMLLLGGRLCEVLCRPTTHLLPPF